MTELWHYLLKMSLSSGLLFGYYRVALYNEKFHQWNRFYLLTAMILSLLVPFANIPFFETQQNQALANVLVVLPWNAYTANVSAQNAWTVSYWILLISSIISGLFFAKMLFGFAGIYKNYIRGSINKMDNIKLILTDDKAAPYSFFKWLFWRSDIEPNSPNGQRMLQHELTHIAEKHSWDKLFCEVLLMVFWVNPFFWLMRKELDAIHEFLADRKAIDGKDGAAFATMILQAAHALPAYPVTNPFFSSNLKRRLYMITNSKRPQYAYLRRIFGLILMIFTTFALALSIQKVQAQTPDKPVKSAKPAKPSTPSKAEIPTKPSKPDTLIWVQEAAIAPTDVKDITVDSKSNQVYITTKNGNKVYVIKDPKIIEKIIPPPPPPAALQPGMPPPPPPPPPSKKLSDVINPMVQNDSKTPMYLYAGLEITAEQLKQIGTDKIAQLYVYKGEEAIKKYGEKGKNGVIEIIPKLENPGEKAMVNLSNLKLVGPLGNTPNPLYVVDGVKVNMETLNALKPENISAVNVLKGESAKAWGEDGKNGVIMITTKKNAEDPLINSSTEKKQK